MNQPRDGTRDHDARKEVFRGHFEECVQHLRQALLSQLPENLAGAEEQRKPIAEFCDVTTRGVAQLLTNDMKTFAWRVIRFMCYLDMIGYRVIELEGMKPAVRCFTELIGYGIFTPQAACEAIGYVAVSTLYDVMKGRHSVSDAKLQIMWNIWKERKDELEARKRELSKFSIQISMDFVPGDRSLASSSVAKRSLGKRKPLKHSMAVIHLMKGLSVLLDDPSMSACLKEVEQHPDVVLSLSAQMSALSSRILGLQHQEQGASEDGED